MTAEGRGDIGFEKMREGERTRVEQSKRTNSEEMSLLERNQKSVEYQHFLKSHKKGGISFAKPIFDEGEEETDFGGVRSKSNEIFRENVKEAFPDYTDDVEVAQIGKQLSVRLYGDKNQNWRPVYNIDGKTVAKSFSDNLKAALDPNGNIFIKKNNEMNSAAEARIGKLNIQREREDISEEVRNTTNNEIEQLENGIEERTQENERIEENTSWRERIKNKFKKHGLTVFSILSSLGVIISVIVSKLTSNIGATAAQISSDIAADISSAVGDVTKYVGKGFKKVGTTLKDIGKALAKILPGMIGAIASFIFKLAGEAVGFLAKNAWLLILFVVTLAIEQYSSKASKKK